MDSTKKSLPEGGPGNIPQHGHHGGDLGVDINSSQPPTSAPAFLHLSQVPENMRSVGQEPPVDRLPTDLSQPTNQPKLVYEPEAGMFVPDISPQKSADPSSETYIETGERLLNQAVHKAEGLFGEVKDLAGTALKGAHVPTLHDVKELAGSAFEGISSKASGAWHAVAGTIGAGPGKELSEDQTERFVAGQDRELHQVKSEEDVNKQGTDLGVDISSYQPPANAPAGLYPHGEIKKGDASGHRPSEVVGENTALPGT